MRTTAIMLTLALATTAQAQVEPQTRAATQPAVETTAKSPAARESAEPEPNATTQPLKAAPPPVKRAESTPSLNLPEVPDAPDEPLPEWRQPPPRKGAMFLQMGPEVQSAQRLRQAGLWVSSIGWAQLLASGILYGWAANLTMDISHPHADGSGMVNSSGPITQTQTFDPSLEDERDRVANASLGLATIGGAMALTGFIIYTVGQTKITIWHKSHPKDPLPPLSGF